MDVSVIIPLYNGERFLAETLRAVLAQTRPPVDILVVDDGSSDDGPAIARSFAPRVTLLSPGRNAGVQAARNVGIARARGDWIAFCDQDDLWHPGYLEAAARLAAAAPRARFIFDNFRYERDGVPDDAAKFDAAPPGWWDRAGRRILPEGWVLDAPIAGLSFEWTPVFPSAMLVARSLIEEVGPFDERMRGLRPEDWEFILRCTWRAEAAALPGTLVSIRRHDSNFSRHQCLCLVDEVALMRFVLEHHREAEAFRPVIEAQIRRRRLAALDLAFAERNHALARRLLAEVPAAERSAKLRLKAACLALPDRLGLRVNGALQRAAALRRPRLAQTGR